MTFPLHPTPVHQRGFSVIEAIAAMAILALGAIPLLSLHSRLTHTVMTLERSGGTAVMERSALAYLRVSNPMREPSGSIALGEAFMRWEARPVTEERPVFDAQGAAGRFVIRLYEIDYEIIVSEDGPALTRTIRKAGWRPVGPVLEK